MRLPLRPTVAAALAALALAPAGASAGTFTGDVVDDTGALVELGDLDLARDGTGVAAWTRLEDGVEHVFASRFAQGAWTPPTRVDVGIADAGRHPAVAATDNGRAVVTWSSAGTVHTATFEPGAPAWTPPAPVAPGDHPDVDLSINAVAYLVYTAPGDDVRAARADRGSRVFVPLAQPLDLVPGQPAGATDARRPSVAIAADGTALAVWGESGADGRSRVIARRIFGANVSAAPRDLGETVVAGRPGGDADAPEVEVQDDSSYGYVTFRQTVDGVPRTILRQLIGSEFDPSVVADAAGVPAAASAGIASLDVNGGGDGLVGMRRSDGSIAATDIEDRKPDAGRRLDTGGAQDVPPFVARSQNEDGLVGWLGSDGLLRGRLLDERVFGPEEALSRVESGPVDRSQPVLADADRAGGFVVLAVHGGAEGGRRLVSSVVDRPPGRFRAYTTQRSRNVVRPKLSWASSFNLWGPVTYAVSLNGVPLGTTGGRSFTLPADLPEGLHRWTVTAVDRRFQPRVLGPREIKVDLTPPVLEMKQKGSRRAGRDLLLEVDALDPAAEGSDGLRRVRIDWGDGSKPRFRREGESLSGHRYVRRGVYRIRVSATDVAGNETVETLRVQIARARRR